MIEYNVTTIDSATPFLKYMAVTKPDWMRKAMKSAGWWMKKEIQAGIRSGAPGGRAYPAAVPPEMRNLLRAYYGGKDKRKFPPLGDLVKAVGYQYDQSSQSVAVGWLSRSAVVLGTKIEAGSQKTITPKMRKFFFASGVPLGTEQIISVAPRNTFGPMKQVLEPKTADYIEGKIIEYMQSGGPGPSTTRRRYTVYGARNTGSD